MIRMIDTKQIHCIMNSPSDDLREEEKSGYMIRRKAVDRKIPLITNVKLAKVFVRTLVAEEKAG